MIPVYTITFKDVGRSTIKIEGRKISILEVMGKIQLKDIRKNIYLDRVRGILQIENDWQRDARLTRGGKADIIEALQQAVRTQKQANISRRILLHTLIMNL